MQKSIKRLVSSARPRRRCRVGAVPGTAHGRPPPAGGGLYRTENGNEPQSQHSKPPSQNRLVATGSGTKRRAPRDAAALPPNPLGAGIALPTPRKIKLNSNRDLLAPSWCSGLCPKWGFRVLAVWHTVLARGCPGTAARRNDLDTKG